MGSQLLPSPKKTFLSHIKCRGRVPQNGRGAKKKGSFSRRELSRRRRGSRDVQKKASFRGQGSRGEGEEIARGEGVIFAQGAPAAKEKKSRGTKKRPPLADIALAAKQKKLRGTANKGYFRAGNSRGEEEEIAR